MSIKDTWKKLVIETPSRIRDLNDELLGANEGLAAEDKSLEAEWMKIVGEKAPKTETLKNVDLLVNARRAELLARFGLDWVGALGGVGVPLGPETAELRPGKLPDLSGLSVADYLILVAPDVAKAGCKAIVNDVQYPEGPPMRVRLPRLLEIVAQRAAIVQAQAALADAASNARLGGIPLPAAEAVRRLQAQQRHDRWAADEALTAAARRGLPHVAAPEPPRE